jgi:hypothetical protein
MPKPPTDGMTATIPPEELADATLTVQNPRAKPVTVFAEQGSSIDVRLGQAPAHGRATLRFPKSVVRGEEVRVFVHPEGGFDLSAQTLHVHPGEHLGLGVPLH